MAHPSLIFGGGTIGLTPLNTIYGVNLLLQSLSKFDIWRLDSAPVYPATDPGKCEQLLGEVGVTRLGFTVDSKIKVTGEGPGKGSLTTKAIEASINETSARLGIDQVSSHY